MIQPFPTDPAAKKQVMATLQSEGDSLLDQIAEIRKQFPRARMTYVKTRSLELGKVPPEGVPPTADQILLAGRPERLNAARLEAERREKARIAKSNGKRKRT